MSIGKRVSEAFKSLDAGDAENALLQICPAISATTTKLLGGDSHKLYKQFVHDNLGLITKVGLGRSIENMNVAFTHDRIESDANGLCSIEQIAYHAIRCGLAHSAKLPDDLTFDSAAIIKVESGKLVLPSRLVLGFIVAVIGCPVNAGETAPDDYAIDQRGLVIPLNKLWGKGAELLRLLDAMDAVLA